MKCYIRYCVRCREYTLHEKCPICGMKTINPHPPRFSPEDRWGEYRRKEKMRHEDG